jgi:hypothetical protein
VGQGGTLWRLTRTGGDCTFALSAASAAFFRRGGSGSLTLTAANGCGWTASTTDAWIRITSAPSGAGSGTITYTIGANSTGRDRYGSVLIAGQMVLVFQSENDQSRKPSLHRLSVGPLRPARPTKGGGKPPILGR